MKNYTIMIGIVILALVLAAGCGDDDKCPVCPEYTQTAVVLGNMYLNAGILSVGGDVIGINGFKPELDSIKINDTLIPLGASMMGTDVIHFQMYQLASVLSGGDTVAAYFYAPTGTSTAKVKLLDFSTDAVNLISPSPGQNFALQTDVDMEWDDIANADWFQVRLDYRFLDSSGVEDTVQFESIQTDTIYTVPGNMLVYNGNLILRLAAGTGHRPDASQGNVSGPAIKGNMSSTYTFPTSFSIGSGLRAAGAPVDVKPGRVAGSDLYGPEKD